MVTLRRDIAAASKNKVFDRKDRDSEVLTDYDLFMEKKKQQRYFCEYKPAKPSEAKRCTAEEAKSQEADAFSKIFDRASITTETVPQTQDNEDDYKRYLLEQLNRSEPDVLLSKEDFYSSQKPVLAGAPAARSSAIAKPSPKRLSKNGKIFVAIYVLVVAIVASIILAVNSVSSPTRVDASAISDNAEGVISPMDVPAQGENASSNWFDKLLDGLSNG